jgi:PAS domain S-box-containing protein
MSDQDKSRDELITELLDARLRIAQMERASMGLKRSRSDLEEIKEQFIAQFEAMPIPSYTWEWNGYDFLLVDYNESAEEITRGEIIRFRGTTASELYHDNREIVDDLTTCLKEERSSRREMTYRLKTTGEEKYLSLTYAFVPPNLVMVHTEDITERKANEAALREVNERLESRIEERTGRLVQVIERLDTEIFRRMGAERALEGEKRKFQMLSDHSPFGIVLISTTGSFDYINPKFSEMFGYDLTHCPDGKHWFRAAYPDPEYRRAVISAWLEDVAGPSPGEVRPREFTVTCRNGEEKIIHFRPVQLETGGHLMTCEDVTEQRKTDRALRESEERFRRLSAAATEGIAIHEKGIILDANEALARMFGYELPEMIGMNAEKCATPESWKTILSKIAGGSEEPYEVVGVRKDGSTFPCELVGKPFRYHGKEVRLSAFRDVTERKKAEEALRSSEEKYRLLAENVSDVIWTSDLNLRMTYVSPSVEGLNGWTTAEWLSLVPSDYLPPASMERALTVMREELAIQEAEGASPDRVATLELEQYRKDGSIFWTEVSARFLFDEGLRPVGVIGVTRDITERKKTEEALRTSEAQLSNAVEMARLGHWKLDVIRNEFTFNDQFYKLFRTTAEQVGGYKMALEDYARRFVHPDEISVVSDENRKAIETDDPYFSRELEHRIVYADGEIGHISVRFFVVKDEQGRTVRTYGVNQDITERKKAEEALRQSQELFKKTFLSQRDAIFILSAETPPKILDCNPMATEIFGYTREQMVSLTTDFLHVDEAALRQFREYLLPALEEQDGAVFPTEHTVIPLEGGQGQRIGWVSLVRDISEQKQAEARIKESLKEKEVLLREIHHRVKNNLQVMSSLMRLQARHVKDQSSRILFEEAEQRVLTMALVHERLYHSENLAEIDFGRFVEELLRFLTSSYGIGQKTITVRKTIPRTNFPLDTAIPLGFIITELVTNCFRHAFPEQEGGEVQVTLEHLPEGGFRLRVADNGIGIAEGIDPLSPNSLGMRLIRVFVNQLGGSLDIRRDNGAEFRIMFSLDRNSTDRPLEEGS